MRRTLGLAFFGLLTVFGESAPADIYVLQAGNGSAALGTASTVAFLQKFADTGGTPTTFNVSSQDQPYTIAGSASSEGFLALSPDGLFITAGGYGIGPGSAAVAGSMSATVPREVMRFQLGVNDINISTVFNAVGDTTFSTNNIRSAVTNDGGEFWMGGSNQGLRYATHGANTSSVVSNTATNLRVAKIFDGQLYVSSGATNFSGVNKVGTGLPTGTGETITNVFSTVGSGTGQVSPYDFFRKDASTFYITDDRSVANGGGIQKWTESGGTWTLAYTLALGTGTGGAARGLSGTINDSGNAVLYATTTEASSNRLVTITDTGQSSTFTLLATAPTNTAFRGVAFVPTLAPANDADFNGDGTVNGEDFLLWQAGFQKSGTAPLAKINGNANTDGVVDSVDYDIWRSKFGGPPAVAAANLVPEPAAAVLGAIGAAIVVARRRRATRQE